MAAPALPTQMATTSQMLARANRGVLAALSSISSACLFGLTLLICADIVGRNLFNRPISGTAELVALTIVACVFLQIPNAIAQGRLLRVDLIIEPLARRWPASGVILQAAFATVGLFLFYKILAWAWPDFVRAWQTNEFKGAHGAFTIPVWPFKLALIIGTVVGLVQFAVLAVDSILGASTRGEKLGGRTPRAWIPGVLVIAAAIAWLAFLFAGDHRAIEIGVYCLVAMIGLVLLGMPIPLALMGVSFVGIWAARGAEFMATNTLGIAAASTVSSYQFAVIPLFVTMGLVLEKADVGRDAFAVAAALLRRVRGGLGIATVFANAIFAAIVGSSIASAAVFSRIAAPVMVTHGYDKRFALGCVAGSSVLGMLIPPSLLLIIYGLLAEESVGKLFIAAIIPGLTLALAFSLFIYGAARFWPSYAGPTQSGTANETPLGVGEALAKLAPISLLVVVVIGGIYGGFFTPTEAAAVGTALAFLIALVKRRLTWPVFKEVILESGFVSTVILFLIIAASFYSRQTALTGLPMTLAVWLESAGFEMAGFLAAYLVIVLLLGMILDSVSIMLIILPIALPLVMQLGGDKIWFGIVTIIAVEIGLLTPPFGLSVYAMKGVLRDFTSLADVFIGVLPFVVVMILVTFLIMAVPELSLWLVRS